MDKAALGRVANGEVKARLLEPTSVRVDPIPRRHPLLRRSRATREGLVGGGMPIAQLVVAGVPGTAHTALERMPTIRVQQRSAQEASVGVAVPTSGSRRTDRNPEAHAQAGAKVSVRESFIPVVPWKEKTPSPGATAPAEAKEGVVVTAQFREQGGPVAL